MSKLQDARATEAAVRRGLAYLETAQRSDGSFDSYASEDSGVFTGGTERPTTFVTGLVFTALGGLKKADLSELMRTRGIDYLAGQLNERWSANYEPRSHIAAAGQAYPDDLDDTMVVLSALWLMRPNLIPESAMGHIARLLIHCETKPGGPYRTWLVGENAPQIWRDVDLGVNGNIGYFLSLRGVSLPGLAAQWNEALDRGKVSSAYYVGRIAIIYFWLRSYGSDHPSVLQDWTRADLEADVDNPLMLALAISNGLRLGMAGSLMLTARDRLAGLQSADGSWPAAGLFCDSVEGRQQFIGSAALTTALCLEALTRLAEHMNGDVASARTPLPAPTQAQIVAQRARSRAHRLPAGWLRESFEGVLEGYIGGAGQEQITRMPELAMEALGYPVTPLVQQELALGSLYGWMAYTIYDDFLDDEGDARLLGVANVALRETVASFERALPRATVFQKYVRAVLDGTDAANTWEVSMCRAARDDRGGWTVARLPRYGNFDMLVKRSLGHSLAAVGVATSSGLTTDSTAMQSLHQFFRHFLIARQLNDDAHDWETDLSRGHLTAAVSQVLRGWAGRTTDITVDLAHDMPALRQQFWQSEIDCLSALILDHGRLAREALERCADIARPECLTNLVAPLETAAHEALSEKRRVLEFIAGYEAAAEPVI